MNISNHKFGTRIGLLTLFLLAGLGFHNAQAEIVEIPLPALVGPYSIDGVLWAETTIPFNMDPANIVSVSLRMSGTLTNGIWICDGPELVWHMHFAASMIDDTTGGWWATQGSGSLATGLFSFTYDFIPSFTGPPTWNFLGAGTGGLLLDGGSVIGIADCPALEWVEHPSAEVTEAVLVFDMTSTVPAEGTSWGAMKALYR